MPTDHSSSPTGWWIAGLLEKQSDPERAPYWNNYRLVRADDWRLAYQRAVEMGLRDAESGNRAFSHQRKFLGVSDLLPIYDAFDDGAEILWQELWPEDDGSDSPPLRVFTEDELAERFDRTKHPFA